MLSTPPVSDGVRSDLPVLLDGSVSWAKVLDQPITEGLIDVSEQGTCQDG